MDRSRYVPVSGRVARFVLIFLDRIRLFWKFRLGDKVGYEVSFGLVMGFDLGLENPDTQIEPRLKLKGWVSVEFARRI